MEERGVSAELGIPVEVDWLEGCAVFMAIPDAAWLQKQFRLENIFRPKRRP